MRTLLSSTNQVLRDALIVDDDLSIPMLLASTVAVTHDGTLQLEEDGSLPKGEPLPLGICRAADGTYLISTFTDPLAVSEPKAPTAGVHTPYVPITGDDLFVLAATNHVGLHFNPGSFEQLVVSATRVREVALRIRDDRKLAGVRSFDDRTLVTLRGIDLGLSDEHEAVLVRELVTRGASVAFVAEYALHDDATDPDEFTQLLVVGNEEGFAGYDLREDTRRVLTYLTGRSTDSVAYSAMPQVRHVTQPTLRGDGPLPEPLVGVV